MVDYKRLHRSRCHVLSHPLDGRPSVGVLELRLKIYKFTSHVDLDCIYMRCIGF